MSDSTDELERLSRMPLDTVDTPEVSSTSSFGTENKASGASTTAPVNSDADIALAIPDDFAVDQSLRWPQVEGYEVDEQGVFRIVVKADKHLRIAITHAPCGTIAWCRDRPKQQWGACVQWIDRDGHRHMDVFPVGRFHDGIGLAAELATRGLPIVVGQEKELLRYLEASSTTIRYRAAMQTGWHDGLSAFVLPSEVLQDGHNHREGSDVLMYFARESSLTQRSVKEQGSRADWKELVAARCSGNPVLIFFVAASLSAPILRLLNLEGGGFHLYGQTSHGKTTALQVAGSVWGSGIDPSEGPQSDGTCSYLLRWNATKNAFEGLAEAHNDLPLCLDEVAEADGREFGKIIYQLAGGHGKSRMRADTSLKIPKSWRVMVLSTGEVAIAGVLAKEGQQIKGGQAVRLLDIPAQDAENGAGIIDCTHNAASPRVFVDALKRACATDYGTAGPDFVRALFRDGIESVQGHLRLAVEQTTKALMPPGASTEVMRAVKRFAVVAVVGELAIAMGIVPWTKGEVFRAVKKMMTRWLRSRGGHGGEMERAETAVRDYILRHESSRFRDVDDQSQAKVINLVGYRDRPQGLIHFTPQGFREACGDHDPLTVAQALAEKGCLETREKDRCTNRITISGVGRIRVYTVTAALLEEDVNDGELVQRPPGPATKDA